MLTRLQQLEQKLQEHRDLRERREYFETEMKLIRQREAQSGHEVEQLAQELSKTNVNHGYQSEPTTPPEYRDQLFSSAFSSRTNRFSSSSLTSPPGLSSRSHRSGSQLTSPPSEIAQNQLNHNSSDSVPSKSVPGSRRGSNDRVAAYVPETTGSARRAARYSMPVNGLRSRTHESVPEHSVTMGLGSLNTTSFLFDDEEKDTTISPGAKTFNSITDDNFPVLRRDGFSGVVSCSLSQAVGITLRLIYSSLRLPLLLILHCLSHLVQRVR